ncbi:unnamed protein product, partial [Rotaria sp. Silwood2]
IVFLNGHLHSLRKHLYARHSDGLLELELEDWKVNRKFRIVTIDAGILSFGDFRFGQSIYAVICNPKETKFKTPREPLYRLSQSTHIRIRLRMILLCSVDLFYYSLIGLAVYHFIGPWYIGYLSDDYFGAIFLWGVIVRGIHLPSDIQSYVGIIQFLFFLIPLTLCLCSSCYNRYIQLQPIASLNESYCNRAIRILTVYILFGYALLFVLYWSYMNTASYKLAWILSPFSLILAIFSFYLYGKSKQLKIGDFKLLQSTTNSYHCSIRRNTIEMDNGQNIITSRRAEVKNH